MLTDKAVTILELIELLSGREFFSSKEIGRRLGFSDRQARSYIEILRRNGFVIAEHHHRYRIDFRSPFFQILRQRAIFSETEAEMVCRILYTVDADNDVTEAAKQKLIRYYGLEGLESPVVQQRQKHKLDVINEAIAKKQMLLIKGYSSPHSKSTKDRIVEPFLLMNQGIDVRCHEISTHMNKTFKVSRMADVELLDVPWIGEKEHRKIYTDLFMFSGEEVHHVKVLMGQLSHNLMLEEYPRSERYFSRHDDMRWLLETDVVSFLGIGRFVLGLWDDVEVLGNDDFKAYLDEKLRLLSSPSRQ